MLDVTRDWRFQVDPGHVGLREGWAAPGYDDHAWPRLAAGKPWEEQGFPNYDGYAWYRRSVSVPAGWRGLPLYLWLSGIDDEADVFVDGVLVAHFGDRASNDSAHHDRVPVDITALARGAGVTTVAVRVNDWGGIGGLTMRPAALVTSGVALFSADEYVKNWFRHNPDLPWPYWLAQNRGVVKPQGAAWAMVGTEGSTAKALVGLDSSIMPNQEGIALTPWIYDQAAARLYSPQPSEVAFSLLEGYLPIPTAKWDVPGLAISSTLFVSNAAGDGLAGQPGGDGPSAPPTAGNTEGDVTFYAVTVGNSGAAPRELSLLLALRPYGVAGRLSSIYSLAQAGPAVLVNGAVGLLADRLPDGFGATSSAGGDVGFFAASGELPPHAAASDDQGLASAALKYRLLLQPGEHATLTFKLPVLLKGDQTWIERLQALDFGAQRDAALRYWRARLGGIQLSLPDARYSNAYYASLANLYMARNGDLLLPGPLVHRRFWYRDAAYLSTALLRAGQSDIVKRLLAQSVIGQLPSGEFPPILRPDGRPDTPEKHEWDAQGEGIYAMVAYYRWTKDAAWLRQVYPTIRRAALFVRSLRTAAQRPELRGTPAYGILPPSESAEDLGPAEWHHYWDDFWAIAGLREASFAASELGEAEDARWLADEEAQLTAALLESIRMVQQKKGIDFVPNGPEDTDTPAMARGTTPALWPAASFDARDWWLRRSFEVYFLRWIAPYGGAYRHEGNNYWPYGGLQLAHVYLLLDMPDRVQAVLDWTLANQTFPGLYAWAESVSPETNRFAGGDMPHAWAAAEYTLLLRDMLLREHGDRLILASYLPRPWLADGQRVAAAGLPTLFGPAGYTLESHAAAGYWHLSIRPGASPPGGYLWRLPAGIVVGRVEVDGQPWREYDGEGVRLPAATRTARVYGQLAAP